MALPVAEVDLLFAAPLVPGRVAWASYPFLCSQYIAE
jgi:hypothetical protein